MAGRRSVARALLALALLLALAGAKKSREPPLKGSEKLAQLHGRVRDGVVELTGELFERFVSRPDRPYHLMLLFTASADKYKCETCQYVTIRGLKAVSSGDLRRNARCYSQVAPEFVVLGESYEAAKQAKVDTRDGLEVFFAVVDFDANQQAFGMVRPGLVLVYCYF